MGSLLAGILRQTLYSRMEGLILGHPQAHHQGASASGSGWSLGPRSRREEEERSRIVEAAVENYRRQQRHTPPEADPSSAGEEEEGRHRQGFSNLAGMELKTSDILRSGNVSQKEAFKKQEQALFKRSAIFARIWQSIAIWYSWTNFGKSQKNHQNHC